MKFTAQTVLNRLNNLIKQQSGAILEQGFAHFSVTGLYNLAPGRIKMHNKKMTQFTLIDVIERKIHFTKTNNIYDEKGFENVNEGELLAYKQLLVDAKEMNENEFVGKYHQRINTISKQFENEEFNDEKEIDKISGYNNAVVSVLMCINPLYEYDLDD